MATNFGLCWKSGFKKHLPGKVDQGGYVLFEKAWNTEKMGVNFHRLMKDQDSSEVRQAPQEMVEEETCEITDMEVEENEER